MVKVALQGIEETQDCYCLAARKRARELTRRYEAALRPFGLRATQFSVLAALVQTGPLALSRLAELLGLERTTMTRVAAVMERDGRITASQGEDERVRILSITPAGKQILAAALPEWKRVQADVARAGG